MATDMRAERGNFEKLNVYKIAEELSDEILAVVMRWEHFAKDTAGKQLVRAADDVGANIAEWTLSELREGPYVRRHWLRRAHERNLLPREALNKLRPLMMSSARD